MMILPSPIQIRSCLKGYTNDLDKACDPASTIKSVHESLARSGLKIYAGSRRIDTGRLGIPVYLGLCDSDARKIMPVRKQMGKGSSPEQAEASALMEFMERYAFFSFWQTTPGAVKATWKEAEAMFGERLISLSAILRSVHDSIPVAVAREILSLQKWLFYPATHLASGTQVWLPIDWFKMLGEFNGSSAGNTNEESLLQGVCELIERNVCAIADSERPIMPTIDPESCTDPALKGLLSAFAANNIRLLLKDMSLGIGLPTVGALAYDETTFPDRSEIVFTAGTATSPQKAAIRAITEVAQLGGDFCTGSCYEASGLPKFTTLEEIQWLAEGPLVAIASLPDQASNDIGEELLHVIARLAPVEVYAIQTTHPELGIPAHYCIAPGLEFRERDRNQSLGLFAGRKLIEEAAPEEARAGLAHIGKYYPDAHFMLFFQGQIALKDGDPAKAAAQFESAFNCQPDEDSRALAAFYAGYAHTLKESWTESIAWLELALKQSPAMKEAANLLGVANFKLKNYAIAEDCFNLALKIDKGSAMDLANRGIVRKLLGKRSEAIEDLTNALELQPDLDFAFRHLQELLASG